MKWKWGAGLLSLVLVLLTGCGAGRTMVLDVPVRKVSASGITLVRADSTVDIPDELVVEFEEELRRNLFESEDGKGAPFTEGSDLKLEYCIIQYDRGNQFARYMWGGIGNAGEGTLTVQVRYLDAADQEIARIQSLGKIGSGIFGGSFKAAVNKCAREIADYTVANFQ